MAPAESGSAIEYSRNNIPVPILSLLQQLLEELCNISLQY